MILSGKPPKYEYAELGRLRPLMAQLVVVTSLLIVERNKPPLIAFYDLYLTVCDSSKSEAVLLSTGVVHAMIRISGLRSACNDRERSRLSKVVNKSL